MDFDKIIEDLKELRKKYVEDGKGRNKIEGEIFSIIKDVVKDENIYCDCDKMFSIIDNIVDDNNKEYLLGKYYKFLMDNYGKSTWRNYRILEMKNSYGEVDGYGLMYNLSLGKNDDD